MNDLKGLKLNEIELKESDLDEFAKDFVTKLSIPSVIGFNGSLGAGKTSIIKKIIYHLGIEDNVTSPTFNIVKNYLKEDLSIYHVDLYRLSSFQEFIDLDLPLFEEKTLFFVGWSNSSVWACKACPLILINFSKNILLILLNFRFFFPYCLSPISEIPFDFK